MAFSTQSPTPTTWRTRLKPYHRSLAITGTFLVIVLLLWIFQTPIQNWWKNLRNRTTTDSVVTLPNSLVAKPIPTPSPTKVAVLPAPPATPTPYATSSVGTKLPKSGPSDDLFIVLFISTASGIVIMRHILLYKSVEKSARNIRAL